MSKLTKSFFIFLVFCCVVFIPALNAYGDEGEPRQALASRYVREWRYDEVISIYKNIVNQYGRQSTIGLTSDLQLCKVYAEIGEYDIARREMDLVIKNTNPAQSDINNNIKNFYLSLKKIKINKNSHSYINWYKARNFENSGRYALADKYYKSAVLSSINDINEPSELVKIYLVSWHRNLSKTNPTHKYLSLSQVETNNRMREINALSETDKGDTSVVKLNKLIIKYGISSDVGLIAAASLCVKYKINDKFSLTNDLAVNILEHLPRSQDYSENPLLPKWSEIADLILSSHSRLTRNARIQERIHHNIMWINTLNNEAIKYWLKGQNYQYREDRANASKLYIKAYNLLFNDVTIEKSMLNKIVASYSTALNYVNPNDANLMIKGQIKIVCDQRISYNNRFIAFKAISQQLKPEDIYSITQVILSEKSNLSDDTELRNLAAKLAGETAYTVANKYLDDALRCEINGDWANASAKYQGVYDLLDKYADDWTKNYKSHLIYSIPLMNKVAGVAGDTQSPFKYIGIDYSIGNNWRNSVGSEAWSLLGIHSVDFAGGSAMENGGFSYQLISGDKENTPRRWRDTINFTCGRKDVRLIDIASAAGEEVVSFADDNGETYPRGIGPDFYITLNIPEGEHILSIPQHFSDSPDKNIDYGFYIFTGGDTSGTDIVNDKHMRCIAADIIKSDNNLGYMRWYVKGPMRCVMVTRRLNSLNINIPAIFLDPYVKCSQSITDPYILSLLSDSGIQKYSSEPMWLLNKKADDVPDISYTHILDLLNQNYKDLIDRKQIVSKLLDDKITPESIKIITRYLEWKWSEAEPLNAGKTAVYYFRYLNSRYPDRYINTCTGFDRDLKKLTQWAQELSQESEHMRSMHKIKYAEIADDIRWNCTIRLQYHINNERFRYDPTLQMNTVQNIWNTIPRNYSLLYPSYAYMDYYPNININALKLPWDMQYTQIHARLISLAIVADDISLKYMQVNPAEGIDADYRYIGWNIYDARKGKHEYDDRVKTQARMWLDFLANEYHITVMNSAINYSSTINKQEPVAGPTVFIAACAPFLGDLAELLAVEYPGDSLRDPARITKPKNKILDPVCLLRSDQLELLAHSYLGRDINPTDYRWGDLNRSLTIFKYLKSHYPEYHRMDAVNAGISFLEKEIMSKS